MGETQVFFKCCKNFFIYFHVAILLKILIIFIALYHILKWVQIYNKFLFCRDYDKTFLYLILLKKNFFHFFLKKVLIFQKSCIFAVPFFINFITKKY